MSSRTIQTCDICGVEIDPNNKGHWSFCIEKISVDFSSHKGSQRKPFVGDACTNCTNSIAYLVSGFIKDKKMVSAKTEPPQPTKKGD